MTFLNWKINFWRIHKSVPIHQLLHSHGHAVICVIFLFGQQPRRGRCPVEHRGAFIHSFVYPFVCPPLPASMVKSQPQTSNPSLEAQTPALRLKSQPQGSNPSFKAQIPTSRPSPSRRLKSKPGGSNSSLKTKFQPQGQIPALKLKSQLQGSTHCVKA